jgi:hypothetical protein
MKDSLPKVDNFTYKRLKAFPKLVFGKCDVCQRKVPTVYMDQHFQLHVEKKLGEQSRYVACKVCCETVEWSELEMHMNQHNQNGDAEYKMCDVCLSAVQKRSYRKHLLIHDQKRPGKEAPHKCEKCQKVFWKKTHLDSHMNTHLSYGLNTCEICGKSYKHKIELNRHTRKVHLGDLPHKCSLCDKAFLTKHELKKHDMGHKNIRPYHCDKCNKSYITSFELNLHVRTVHEKKLRHPKQKEKRFRCELCQRGFTTRLILSEHMKTHTGEKPFVCEVCGQTFKHKSSVTKHMLMHTGEMPYSCKFCGQKFRANSNMHYHIRKHHEAVNSQFFCQVCGKGFGNEVGLQTHLKKHNIDLHISEIREMNKEKLELLNLPSGAPVTQADSVVTSFHSSSDIAVSGGSCSSSVAGTGSCTNIPNAGVDQLAASVSNQVDQNPINSRTSSVSSGNAPLHVSRTVGNWASSAISALGGLTSLSNSAGIANLSSLLLSGIFVAGEPSTSFVPICTASIPSNNPTTTAPSRSLASLNTLNSVGCSSYISLLNPPPLAPRPSVPIPQAADHPLNRPSLTPRPPVPAPEHPMHLPQPAQPPHLPSQPYVDPFSLFFPLIDPNAGNPTQPQHGGGQ